MQKPDAGGSFTQWAARKIEERNTYLQLLRKVYEGLYTKPDDVEGFSLEFYNDFTKTLDEIGKVIKDADEPTAG